MKRAALTLVGALSAVLLLAGCSMHGAEKSLDEVEAPDITIGRLLESLDLAVQDAHDRYGEELGLDLASVTVSLATTLSKSSTGELSLVVYLAGSRDLSATQTVTVSLKPPKTGSGETVDSESLEDPLLHADLVQAFQAAMLAAKGAKAGLHAIHAGDIPLEVNQIGVSLSFTVTNTVQAGFSATISSLSVSAEKDRSLSETHKISMVFNIHREGNEKPAS